MKRQTTALFVAAFLGLQFISLLHAVEYGQSDHEHNGSVCHIATHLDKIESCGGTVNNDSGFPNTPFLFVFPDGSDANFQLLLRDSLPRAPPQFPNTHS
jgi:hypothetical protein